MEERKAATMTAFENLKKKLKLEKTAKTVGINKTEIIKTPENME